MYKQPDDWLPVVETNVHGVTECSIASFMVGWCCGACCSVRLCLVHPLDRLVTSNNVLVTAFCGLNGLNVVTERKLVIVQQARSCRLESLCD